jgi:hypothetical protein
VDSDNCGTSVSDLTHTGLALAIPAHLPEVGRREMSGKPTPLGAGSPKNAYNVRKIGIDGNIDASRQPKKKRIVKKFLHVSPGLPIVSHPCECLPAENLRFNANEAHVKGGSLFAAF